MTLLVFNICHVTDLPQNLCNLGPFPVRLRANNHTQWEDLNGDLLLPLPQMIFPLQESSMSLWLDCGKKKWEKNSVKSKGCSESSLTLSRDTYRKKKNAAIRRKCVLLCREILKNFYTYLSQRGSIWMSFFRGVRGELKIRSITAQQLSWLFSIFSSALFFKFSSAGDYYNLPGNYRHTPNNNYSLFIISWGRLLDR